MNLDIIDLGFIKDGVNGSSDILVWHSGNVMKLDCNTKQMAMKIKERLEEELL